MEWTGDVVIFWDDIQKKCEENYIENFDVINSMLEQFVKQINALSEQEQKSAIQTMECIGNNATCTIKYLIYTFLLRVMNDKKYLHTIYELAEEDECLTKENKFFLYYQLAAEVFADDKTENGELQIKCNCFYNKIYHEYEQQFSDKLIPIPKHNQKEDVVIRVFDTSFLEIL